MAGEEKEKEELEDSKPLCHFFSPFLSLCHNLATGRNAFLGGGGSKRHIHSFLV
jgi:hypothetical protein